MMASFTSWTNTLLFNIHNRLRLSRKNYHETACQQLDFLSPEQILQIDHLKNKYTVNFENEFNQIHSLENYFILFLLDEIFSAGKINLQTISCETLLDIGSKNFCYVAALFHAFHPEMITGVEIDAYRLYQDFHTRYSYAHYYCSLYANTQYRVMNILDHNEPSAIITCFYPYVSKDPLIAGGLSKKFLAPQKIFEHAYNLLNTNVIQSGSEGTSIRKNSLFIMVNQGEAEFAIAKPMMLQAKFKLIASLPSTQLILTKPDIPIVSLWTA